MYILIIFSLIICWFSQASGRFLVEYQLTEGYPREVDLFICQAVLQFLSRNNEPTASVAFDCYTQEHPQIKSGPPFRFPLLDFIWLLLLCVREQPRHLARFTVLVDRYQPSIRRDPTYREYLDKIAQVFFGVPAPRAAQGGGLLSNLFGSLLDTESDDEEDLPDRAMQVEELD